MIICTDCGATFEESVQGSGIEKNSCPNCGSWGICVAERCPCCGEYMPKVGFRKICKNCEEEFERAVDGFVETYAEALDLVESEVVEMMLEYLERRQ